MLGDKLYSLRKNRNISQEEFAEILNTSRQAVSKWERNEAKPDIDKIILIAKLFNISIDYLLSHEITYSNVDDFLNQLKDCCINNQFTININDIRLWCSKYPNNFKLYVYSADYLFVAYIENKCDEYLDLALICINKAIILFTPEYNEIISLDGLHRSVSEIYLMQKKYDLAKEYVEKNNVYGCEVLLAKCDLALKKYDNALKISSEIYAKSTSNIINVAFVQVMVLLKKKKIQEAYDLVNWTISFINSIKNDDDFFKGVICPFICFKATCEQLLNINNEESIKTLKDIIANSGNLNIASESNSLKYYFGKTDQMMLVDPNNKDNFKEIINQIPKDESHYQILINIYNEIFGGNEHE